MLRLPVPRPHGAQLSIRRKFLVAVAGSAMVLAVIGLAMVTYTTRHLNADARAQLSALANLEQAQLQQRVAGGTDRLGPLAQGELRKAVVAWQRAPNPVTRARVATVLRAARPVQGVVATAVFDTHGDLLATSARPSGARRPGFPTGAAPALVRSLLAQQAPWVAGRAYPTPGGARFPHAVPITAGDRVLAVLVAECDFREISDLVASESRVSTTADVHLVQATDDGSAQIITPLRYRPDVPPFTLIIPRARASAPAVRAITEPLPDVISGATDYRGRAVLAAPRRLDGTPWRLVVKVDESDAFAVSHRMAIATLVGFLAAIATLAVTLLLVARSIIARLRRVTQSATAISRGDLDARVGDPSGDELGMLSAAFDRMADTLSADIGRRQSIEAQLEHQAGHDILTGLPNRARFQERLQRALESSSDRHRVVVMFCDLDEFKSVNDELGHAAGDRLLEVVAHRFRGALRPTDMLARFGGDEFVIVCPAVSGAGEAEALAGRLQASLAEPVVIGAGEAYVSVSIGIALSEDGATPESLVRDADAAMYRAKALGRRRHVTHDESIRRHAGERLSAATELRHAVTQGNLLLAFQPIVHLHSLSLHGMEALVRWPRAGRLVPPAEFVPRAQELGLGVALDHWVARAAVEQLAAWRREDRRWLTLRIALNVSPATLEDDGLERLLREVTGATGVPPRRIVLEVTEEALTMAGATIHRNLGALRAMGVLVAVDDFGSGHSSLARLRDLPADIMKLDRLLVADVDRDPRTREIVSAVVSLATTMRLRVIAEGVERDTQRRVLADLGCHLGQGYHFAPPEARPALTDDRDGVAWEGLARPSPLR